MSCDAKEILRLSLVGELKEDKEYSYRTADPFYYTLLKEFALQHRKKPTDAESILWSFLQKRALGQPFRRQHIIVCFIADFVCLPKKLVIEIDGGYHQLPDAHIRDEERTKLLNAFGFRVIRFTNEEVIFDLGSVLNKIKEQLNT
jgi:guanylate kinase